MDVLFILALSKQGVNANCTNSPHYEEGLKRSILFLWRSRLEQHHGVIYIYHRA